MINKDHLSPKTSNVDEIGQPERNYFFIFLQIITINSIAKIQKLNRNYVSRTFYNGINSK